MMGAPAVNEACFLFSRPRKAHFCHGAEAEFFYKLAVLIEKFLRSSVAVALLANLPPAKGALCPRIAKTQVSEGPAGRNVA